MSETISQQQSRRGWRLGVICGLLLLCVGLGSLIFWLMQGRIVSVRALADGLIYTVAPDVSARLLDLTVEEGAVVREGDVLGHMDVQEFNSHLTQASSDLTNLRPPDMEEIAARLKEAEKAEKDATARLASARYEEEAKKQLMDDSVMVHVQAQLRKRSLGTHVPPQDPQYQAAWKAEEKARVAMERAKKDFESMGRIRAALDQELSRIRYEIQEAKRIASGRRYKAIERKALAYQKQQNRSKAVDGTLHAPVAGKVLKVSATAGEMVARGEPVVLILPSSAGQKGLWVNAWFPLSSRESIKKGLPCSLEKEADGTNLQGQIEAVLSPQPLPEAKGAETGELFLPVRIRVMEEEQILPGETFLVRLQTRSFLGIRLD